MNFQDSDNLIFAAIGALTVIFVCTFVLLIYVCFRYQKRRIHFVEFDINRRKKCKSKPQDLSLIDIGLGNALEQVIVKLDSQWTLDTEYADYDTFIPLCLEILRRCHNVTDRLTTMLLGAKNIQLFGSHIVDISKTIPGRVDDIVRSIYPKLDAQLLEARTSVLILAVGQLAILSKQTLGGGKSGGSNLGWIDEELKEMEQQLLILRAAANAVSKTEDEPTDLDENSQV